jgi:hypothetical protein
MIDSVAVIWPKASSEVTLEGGSHIDGRPELRHHHHDLHARTLCCQADCGTRLDGRIADVNRS